MAANGAFIRSVNTVTVYVDINDRLIGILRTAAGAAHTYLADPGMLFFFPLGTPATWRMLSLRPPVGSGGESPLRWRNSRPSPISTPAAGCGYGTRYGSATSGSTTVALPGTGPARYSWPATPPTCTARRAPRA
jgi:hypothetical protein